MMTREQWQRIDQLFHAVLELDPSEQESFLDEACGGDEALRHEVATLLAAEAEADTVKLTLPAEVAAEMVAQDQNRPIIGQRIGRYKILSLLGAGGMGDVYLAEDKRLGRKVALKLLKESFIQDAERVRRFEQEARSASALNHPNILTIHEISESDELQFIATEFVEGQTLRQRLKDARMTLKEALGVATQVANALNAAHSARIIHRDIKPENIMLRPDGLVKVLDFGLAKLTARSTEVDSQAITAAKNLTVPGMVMGTARYMSPEQARGLEVDERTDIFSTGVVIYEMVTGRAPFNGDTPSDVMAAILHHEPVPLTEFAPDAPIELERIVSKALCKDRDERYQVIKDLQADLNSLMQEPLSREKQPESPKAIEEPHSAAANRASLASKVKRYQRGAHIALAVLILLASVLAYFVLRPPPAPKVLAYIPITNDGQEKVPSTFVGAVPILVVGDKQIYFTKRLGGKRLLYQVSIAGGEAVEIPTELTNPLVLDLSPNRTELLVASQAQQGEWPLWVVPVNGGSSRRLGVILGHGAAWAPNGKKIVYAYGSELYEVESDGTAVRKLVTVSNRPSSPRWSPDGSRLRFAIQEPKTFRTSLWEVPAAGGKAQSFSPGWDAPASLCCGNWTANGEYFIFQSFITWKTKIWAIREPAGSQSKSEPTLLTNGPMDFWYPAPSPDRRRIYAIGVQRRGELARYDAKTQTFKSYLQNISAEHLDFSRDGEWVTYVTYPEGDLWRSKVDGSEQIQLSFPPMRAKLPRWSPDGKRIAFSAEFPTVDPDKPLKTYIVSAGGGAAPQPLTAEERVENGPGWSPNGKMLVVAMTDTQTIHLIDLNTLEVRKLPGSEGMYSPRWSPDGRYIFALSSDSQRMMLFDRTLKKWDVLATSGAGWPHWSQDGKYIYFADFTALFRLRIDDRKIEQLTTLKDLRLASGSSGPPWTGWAPDGSPLVLLDRGIQNIYALELQSR